ncbi:uncharacterized protein [Miscanthus floridulus]|uniref:uncharacterized protein isoform X3 n=1 Tax=Miscanthus floridulus TaxID=154761 RepID=UPI003459B7A1
MVLWPPQRYLTPMEEEARIRQIHDLEAPRVHDPVEIHLQCSPFNNLITLISSLVDHILDIGLLCAPMVIMGEGKHMHWQLDIYRDVSRGQEAQKLANSNKNLIWR